MAPGQDHARRGGFSPLTLGALIFASSLAPLATTVYLPAMPTIADDLAVSTSEIQLTLTAFIVGVAIGQPVIGPLSDRIGRRIPLIVGLSLLATVSFAMAWVDSLGWLVALRLVQGIATAAGMVLGRAIVADRTHGDETAKLLSLMMSIGVLAPVLAPTLGAAILTFGTWHTIFVMLAIIAAVVAVVVIISVPETLQRRGAAPASAPPSPTPASTPAPASDPTLESTTESAPESPADPATPPATPPAKPGTRRAFLPFALFCLAIGFQFATMYAYVSAAPFVFQNLHGFSEFGYAVTAGCISLTMGVVAFVTQRRIGSGSPIGVLTPVRIGSIGVSVLLLGAIFVGLSSMFQPPVWVWIASFTVVVAPVAILSGVNTAMAMGASPWRAGLTSAIIGSVQSAIGAFAPPLAGIGADTSTTAMALVMLVSASMTLIMFVFAVRLSRGGPRASVR